MTAVAELLPWPKGFVNLRASCRTDLEERFAPHVCDAWLGHSSKIAAKHYLQVTPDHWAAALAEADTAGISGAAVSEHHGGVISGVASADLGQSSPHGRRGKGTKKPAEMAGSASGLGTEYPRRDSNP